jgi:hypothetical protein
MMVVELLYRWERPHGRCGEGPTVVVVAASGGGGRGGPTCSARVVVVACDVLVVVVCSLRFSSGPEAEGHNGLSVGPRVGFDFFSFTTLGREPNSTHGRHLL